MRVDYVADDEGDGANVPCHPAYNEGVLQILSPLESAF